MQILRPVVAQCLRGGRSIVNRQSHEISSSPTNKIYKMSNKEIVMRLMFFDPLGAFTIYKGMDTWKTIREMKEYEAKLGKKVASREIVFNFFMPNKVTTVYYDDLKPKV